MARRVQIGRYQPEFGYGSEHAFELASNDRLEVRLLHFRSRQLFVVRRPINTCMRSIQRAHNQFDCFPTPAAPQSVIKYIIFLCIDSSVQCILSRCQFVHSFIPSFSPSF